MRRTLIGAASGLVLLAGALAVAAMLTTPTPVAAQEDEETTEDLDRPSLERVGAFIEDALAPLVEEGVITAEQADAVKQALLEKAEEVKTQFHQRPPHGRGSHLLRLAMQRAAEAIGIEPEELAEALRAGQSIAEVAEANGVDPEAVVQALVEEASSRIDQLAAERGLDPDRVDQLKERLSEHAERLVHGEPQLRFGGLARFPGVSA